MYSPHRLLYHFLIVVALCGTMACTTHQAEHDVALADYPMNNPGSEAFQLAKALRNKGAFDEADSVYQKLLLSTSSSSFEKEYIQLNQLLCRFVSVDTFYLDTTVYSTRFRGLSALINGIALSRKDRSGFETLYKARSLLQDEELTNSFYYFVMFEQLGLAHRQNITHVDSAMHYYKLARLSLDNSIGFEKHRARVAYRLAKIHQVNRDEVTAIGLLDEAVLLDSSILFYIDVLVLKAGLLRAEGRIEESDEIRKQAHQLAVKSKSDNALFITLNEKALYYTSMNNDSSFFKTFQTLKILSAKVVGAETKLNRLLSRHYYVTGKYSQSIIYGEAALEGYGRERFPDSKLVFEALYLLCDSYTQLKNYKMGMRYAYQQLTYSTSFKGSEFSFENAIDKEIQEESYNFFVYDLLGNLYLKEYRHTKNYEDLEKSFKLYSLIDSLIIVQVRTQEEESVLEFSQMGHGIYSNAIETCYALYAHKADNRWLEAAHSFMERSKSMVTHQDVLKHDQSYFPSVPAPVKKIELDLKTKLAAVKRQKLTRNSKALQQLLKEQDLFFQSLEKEYPEYYLARYSPKLSSVAEISTQAIKQKKCILNYHLSPGTLYVIRYGKQTQFNAIKIPSAFTDSLFRFQQILSKPSLTSLSSFKRLSHFIFKIVIQPFNNLERDLEIIPEGVLSYLPFEVLISDTVGDYKTLPYLVKKHVVSYKFSLKQSSSTTEKPIKKIGAYVFTIGNDQLTALPGAGNELKVIKSTFTNSQIIIRVGTDASRVQFLKDLEQDIDLLHISMHATSDPGNRLHNAIYFNSERGIDTVFGFEIVPKNVKAHTVVLTSCQSSFGTIVPGEGTFSLARSFQQTGVKNIIGSLWALPDYSSPILCSVMYQKIKAGDTPALALSKAKVDYLQRSDANLSNPFFWSGLTLIAH